MVGLGFLNHQQYFLVGWEGRLWKAQEIMDHLYDLHPRNLTWNLKISPWKRKFHLETIIFRFPVKFRGCSFVFGGRGGKRLRLQGFLKSSRFPKVFFVLGGGGLFFAKARSEKNIVFGTQGYG